MKIFKKGKQFEVFFWILKILLSFKYSRSPNLELMEVILSGGGPACDCVKTYIFTHLLSRNSKTGEVLDPGVYIEGAQRIPKYHQVLAEFVVRYIQFFHEMNVESVDIAFLSKIELSEEDVEELFLVELESIRNFYKDINRFDELVTKVAEGHESFGMWIFNAEETNQDHVYFKTDFLGNKDTLNLSYNECIRYLHFIASKAIA